VTLPDLGVGVTYFPGIEPVLENNAGSIDVLEVEPQTFWGRSREKGTFHIHEASLSQIRSYPCRKLIHGIGFPVGGTRPPDPAQEPLLRRMIAELRAPWFSEHLSFNRIGGPEGEVHTLFLLPPRQSTEGARAAARSVRALAAAMPIPMAVETGVSYLKPRKDELRDGEFVAAVAEAANCGILLDLHNLWTNERNGRQSMEDFLQAIPLERVWEVHLAGGEERHGYWLDAHSGPVQAELLERARPIVACLPNLRAILLEVFPAYLPLTGEAFFRAQLEELHRLWDLRGSRTRLSPSRRVPSEPPRAGGPAPGEWEDCLGRVVIGRPCGGPLEREFAVEAGVKLTQELLQEFRASSVVNSLRLSTRLLMLTRGADELRQWLERYWAVATPRPFASDEGEGFGEFLQQQELDVPYLREVLAFDRALIATQVDGEPRTVAFPVAPLPLLRALSAGRMPPPPEAGEYELVITPDLAEGVSGP
jgi:uncharacterized protein